MGKARVGAKAPQITLDAGALIAIDRGDRRMLALLDQVLTQGGRFQVPAGALGQAWRDGRRQAKLARFARGTEVEIVPLDDDLSRAWVKAVGIPPPLRNDVIDASIVLKLRISRAKASIVTEKLPRTSARLDPKKRRPRENLEGGRVTQRPSSATEKVINRTRCGTSLRS